MSAILTASSKRGPVVYEYPVSTEETIRPLSNSQKAVTWITPWSVYSILGNGSRWHCLDHVMVWVCPRLEYLEECRRTGDQVVPTAKAMTLAFKIPVNGVQPAVYHPGARDLFRKRGDRSSNSVGLAFRCRQLQGRFEV